MFRLGLEVDLPHPPALFLELPKVFQTDGVGHTPQVEDKLHFDDDFVVGEQVAAHVEGQVEEVAHVVGQQVVADEQAGVVLSVEHPHAHFQSFPVLGHEDGGRAAVVDVLQEGGVGVEGCDLGRGQCLQLLYVLGHFQLLHEVLVHLELLLLGYELANLGLEGFGV